MIPLVLLVFVLFVVSAFFLGVHAAQVKPLVEEIEVVRVVEVVPPELQRLARLVAYDELGEGESIARRIADQIREAQDAHLEAESKLLCVKDERDELRAKLDRAREAFESLSLATMAWRQRCLSHEARRA